MVLNYFDNPNYYENLDPLGSYLEKLYLIDDDDNIVYVLIIVLIIIIIIIYNQIKVHELCYFFGFLIICRT